MTNDTRQVSQLDLFTKGKTPNNALFYNIAAKKLLRIINLNIKDAIHKKEEKNFGNDQSIQFDNELLYPILADYLWKSYEFSKNSSGRQFDDEDIIFINDIINKLFDVRNFQSHYYHDNEALVFKKETAERIEKLYNHAKYSFSEKSSNDISLMEDSIKKIRKTTNEISLFNEHNSKWYISQDGVMFFISFFLTKSEMNRYLDNCIQTKQGKDLKSTMLRKIYSYYTHRNGTTRLVYNQEENLLSTLPVETQDNILRLRQAYKIINYLNNIPTDNTYPAKFPLHFNKNGIGKASTADELVTKAKEFNLFKEFTIKKIVKTITKTTKAKGGVNSKNAKPVQEFGNEYTIEVIQISKGNFNIVIHTMDFHRFIIFAINNESYKVKKEGVEYDIKGEDYITNQWIQYIVARKQFVEFLKNLPIPNKLITENEKLEFRRQWNSHSYFWKGIDPFFKTKLDKFYDSYIKNSKRISDSKEDKIKSCNEKEIEIRFIDMFHKQDEMMRKENLFTRFAVRYIIDNNLFPNWQWQQEKFSNESKTIEGKSKMVNVKTKIYSNKYHETYRLSIDKHQQIVVVCNPTPIDCNNTDEKNKEVILQKFILGPMALRTILLYHVQETSSSKKIEHFLPELQKEVLEYRAGRRTNLNLLTTKYCPPYLQVQSNSKAESKSIDSFTSLVLRKIKAIEDKCTAIIGTEKLPISRNEKNRLIMNFYTLYTWKADETTKVKFLRKNQYQQMSVYHYYLQKTRLDALIKDFKYMIPHEIKNILNKATNIDNLLLLLAEDVKQNILPTFKAKSNTNTTETIEDLCQKLNIQKSVYTTRTDSNNLHIPYAINASQIIMYAENCTKIDTINIARKVLKEEVHNVTDFKQEYILGLKNTHYTIEPYCTWINSNSTIQDATKKIIVKKLKNQIHDIKVQDILLWHIAKKYIAQCNAVVQSMHINITEVGNVRKSVLPLTINVNINEIGSKNYTVNILYHQIDDVLFVENKEFLGKIISYYIRDTQYKDTIIPYTLLTEYYDKIYSKSLHFTRYVFHFEERMFSTFSNEEIERYSTVRSGYRRVGFKKYIQILKDKNTITVSTKDYDKLNEVRNKALHADIPKTYTYSDIEINNFIKTILIDPFFSK